jgi:hypothetical protein
MICRLIVGLVLLLGLLGPHLVRISWRKGRNIPDLGPHSIDALGAPSPVCQYMPPTPTSPKLSKIAFPSFILAPHVDFSANSLAIP